MSGLPVLIPLCLDLFCLRSNVGRDGLEDVEALREFLVNIACRISTTPSVLPCLSALLRQLSQDDPNRWYNLSHHLLMVILPQTKKYANNCDGTLSLCLHWIRSLSPSSLVPLDPFLMIKDWTPSSIVYVCLSLNVLVHVTATSSSEEAKLVSALQQMGYSLAQFCNSCLSLAESHPLQILPSMTALVRTGPFQETKACFRAAVADNPAIVDRAVTGADLASLRWALFLCSVEVPLWDRIHGRKDREKLGYYEMLKEDTCFLFECRSLQSDLSLPQWSRLAEEPPVKELLGQLIAPTLSDEGEVEEPKHSPLFDVDQWRQRSSPCDLFRFLGSLSPSSSSLMFCLSLLSSGSPSSSKPILLSVLRRAETLAVEMLQSRQVPLRDSSLKTVRKKVIEDPWSNRRFPELVRVLRQSLAEEETSQEQRRSVDSDLRILEDESLNSLTMKDHVLEMLLMKARHRQLLPSTSSRLLAGLCSVDELQSKLPLIPPSLVASVLLQSIANDADQSPPFPVDVPAMVSVLVDSFPVGGLAKVHPHRLPDVLEFLSTLQVKFPHAQDDRLAPLMETATLEAMKALLSPFEVSWDQRAGLLWALARCSTMPSFCPVLLKRLVESDNDTLEDFKRLLDDWEIRLALPSCVTSPLTLLTCAFETLDPPLHKVMQLDPDPPLLRSFLRSLHRCGWNCRTQFEEYWVSLLGSLNSTWSDFMEQTEDTLERCVLYLSGHLSLMGLVTLSTLREYAHKRPAFDFSLRHCPPWKQLVECNASVRHDTHDLDLGSCQQLLRDLLDQWISGPFPIGSPTAQINPGDPVNRVDGFIVASLCRMIYTMRSCLPPDFVEVASSRLFAQLAAEDTLSLLYLVRTNPTIKFPTTWDHLSYCPLPYTAHSSLPPSPVPMGYLGDVAVLDIWGLPDYFRSALWPLIFAWRGDAGAVGPNTPLQQQAAMEFLKASHWASDTFLALLHTLEKHSEHFPNDNLSRLLWKLTSYQSSLGSHPSLVLPMAACLLRMNAVPPDILMETFSHVSDRVRLGHRRETQAASELFLAHASTLPDGLNQTFSLLIAAPLVSCSMLPGVLSQFPADRVRDWVLLSLPSLLSLRPLPLSLWAMTSLFLSLTPALALSPRKRKTPPHSHSSDPSLRWHAAVYLMEDKKWAIWRCADAIHLFLRACPSAVYRKELLSVLTPESDSTTGRLWRSMVTYLQGRLVEGILHPLTPSDDEDG
ncbi:unnamed protein product [Cyprideis torosa]|uniref:Uncharacterized protein n=1 Tax=Cyprideis torosa TaxID=163714 RepID=A0A7R8ZLV9_9CRUS|nr:unnamed protein product [Cyprideis torosa]CAG0892776.1 unnamed protein product [Cyprideis torosa]